MNDFVKESPTSNVLHIREHGTGKTLCGKAITSTWAPLGNGLYNYSQHFCNDCTFAEDEALLAKDKAGAAAAV